MDLKNKIALVTGGASGLGQATVEAFVRKEAKVVILDINEDKANEIINNLGNNNVMFISTDIMKEEPVVDAINSIKDNYSVCDEIFVCGGGAFNKTLISNIKEFAEEIFQNEILVDTTKTLGLNPKSVEAGLFAWLAMCKINKIKLNYTEVTGAKEPCILGQVYNIK